LLRLPRFRYLRPKTAREAARMASDLGPRAMFVAGGTDLFPKLKRRQFEVEALIGLDFLSRAIHRGEDEMVVDAGVTLIHTCAPATAATPRPPDSSRRRRCETRGRSAATCAWTRAAITTT